MKQFYERRKKITLKWISAVLLNSDIAFCPEIIFEEIIQMLTACSVEK